jgi:hypothetical protein
MDDGAARPEAQAGWRLAQEMQQRLDLFLLPLLVVLDAHLDARLVRTVAGTVSALIWSCPGFVGQHHSRASCAKTPHMGRQPA